MNYSRESAPQSMHSGCHLLGYVRRHRLAILSALLVTFFSLSRAASAQTITSIQPRTCNPGKTTQLVVRGADLNESLRIVSSDRSISWKIEQVDSSQITFAVAFSQAVQMGPHRLWLSAANGVVAQHTLFVDDLPAVTDNANNHSIDTAQILSNRSTVEGLCEASQSDFYRVHVVAGERLAVEVHTQQLRSPMDPVVRLFDAAGQLLRQVDDSAVGPDCRFSYQFAEAGDYWIEIFDSRNAAAGAAYQLRLGDFPILNQCFPLAARIGQTAAIQFNGPDGENTAGREIDIPSDAVGTSLVSARFDEGQSSCWLPLYCSRHPQFQEMSTSHSLALPVGLNGRLLQPAEVDSYRLRGSQGQAVRFAAKTRSLGSPTLLHMSLLNATGDKIAETAVNDQDEWSFEAVFPEDGEYRLVVTDLLKRGGNEFSYHVECVPAGTFNVAYKPDAKSTEEYAIESVHGGCALDVQIARFGYDGEIDLELTDHALGMEIVNPRVAAKASEARIYLKAGKDWKEGSLGAIKMKATAVEFPEQFCFVSNHTAQRAKLPFLLTSNMQDDGTLIFAAVPAADIAFAMEATTPVKLARSARTHGVSLTLKRLDEKFKAGVDVLLNALPNGWSATSKTEKDQVELTFSRSEQATEELTNLPLQFFSEYNGRGRIANYSLPVQWIDPLRTSIDIPQPLVRGGPVRAQVHVQREGFDPQPVVVTFPRSSAEFKTPESLTIAANETEASFELFLSDKLSLDQEHAITHVATSKFSGQEIVFSATQALPPLVDSPQSLEVYPHEILLTDVRSQQQLAITGIDQQKSPRDWTRYAQLTSSDPTVARVRAGIVYPVANGNAELVVQVGNKRKSISVRVSGMERARRIDFESEVLVALSKQGCNSGACHCSSKPLRGSWS